MVTDKSSLVPKTDWSTGKEGLECVAGKGTSRSFADWLDHGCFCFFCLYILIFQQ